MRRWLILTVRLYPPRWRARYGEEFRALLEDLRPGWREWADVLRGALIMQMTDGSAFLKLSAGLAVAGALVAFAVSFGASPRYTSSAEVNVTSTVDDADEYNRYQFVQIEQEILSRSVLASLIQQPRLKLYERERQRLPLDRVIQQMRHDLEIRPVSASVYRISFTYPDEEKAHEVTRQLATKFCEQSALLNRVRPKIWHSVYPLTDPPPGPAITMVNAAGTSDQMQEPNRLLFAAGGVLLGLLAAVSIRRPSATLRLAAWGVAGCILAYGLSFLFPANFTSTAIMLVTASKVPEPLAGVPSISLAEQVSRAQEEVLSDANLARLIKAPALDLYKEERAHSPLPESIQKMRQTIRIQRSSIDKRAFQISFSYPDRFRAKQVVDNLVVGLAEHTRLRLEAALNQPGVSPVLRSIYEHAAAGNLELLDPASLPELPDRPNRLLFAAAGLALGLLAGLLFILRPPAALSPLRACSSLACWLF